MWGENTSTSVHESKGLTTLPQEFIRFDYFVGVMSCTSSGLVARPGLNDVVPCSFANIPKCTVNEWSFFLVSSRLTMNIYCELEKVLENTS